MFSKARARRQSRAPRHMHFSLLWKLNFRSRGLIFLNPKQRSNRKYVALVDLRRNVAIRLSKSISKFCMSTFTPLRKALRPALPKGPVWVPGWQRREPGSRHSTGHPRGARGRATADGSWARGELRNRASSEDLSPLGLFTYFLLCY